MHKRQALHWLEAAKDDLDTITYLIDDEHLTNIVAFHAHQAVEKSLKALIEYNETSVHKTHNLERLYNNINEQIRIDYDMLELLNELYIESRYPGDMGLLPNGKPTLEEAKNFYMFARFVYEEIGKKIRDGSRLY